jgi:ElaB/YqjD/DUF883 family membrane-anchored ribosome-binding protein
MDHTGDFGREAGADVTGPRSTEVHSHLSAGADDAGMAAAAATEAEGAAAKAANRVREGAEDAVERVREAGQHAYDRVQQAKEKLDDGWSEARTRARDAMNSAREAVDSAEDLLERRTGLLPWVRSNPMPAAMIAFGAGLVLSGGALGGRRSGIRGQLRSALLSSLGGMLMTQARGFLDETLRS